MRCLKCNYDLSGLTEHRCPECGRGFDPANHHTYFSIEREVEACRRSLRNAKAAALFSPIAALVIIAQFLFVDAGSAFFDVGLSVVGVFGVAAAVLGFLSLVLVVSVLVAGRPCRRVMLPEALRTLVIVLLYGALAVGLLIAADQFLLGY